MLLVCSYLPVQNILRIQPVFYHRSRRIQILCGRSLCHTLRLKDRFHTAPYINPKTHIHRTLKITAQSENGSIKKHCGYTQHNPYISFMFFQSISLLLFNQMIP